MTKDDIMTFIKEMGSIGDDWTEDQVEKVYVNSSLDDALSDRKAAVGTFFDIIGKVINRD